MSRPGRAAVFPAAAALAVSLAAWLSCVIASVSGWHSAVTGPAAAILAVPLLACGIWLNRSAGDGGDPGEDPACPYEDCHHNHPGRGPR